MYSIGKHFHSVELIRLDSTTKVFSVKTRRLSQDIIYFHVVMSPVHVAFQPISRRKVNHGSLLIFIPVPRINFSMDIQYISIVQPYAFKRSLVMLEK